MLRFYRRVAALGAGAACHRRCLCRLHRSIGDRYWRGRGGMWKGRAQAMSGRRRDRARPNFASGKGHRDENFPVASRLVRARASAADPRLLPLRARRRRYRRSRHGLAGPRSCAELERMEAALRGETDAERRRRQAARRSAASADSPTAHALDLLEAFRRDVTKLRYRDWDELMDYCRYSAMPVGRFVLDVHGESTALWPANDALCAALQVINHLQDCAKDYRELDRVYIPLDALAAARRWRCEASRDPRASPALRDVIAALGASALRALLDQSRPFADGIADRRLALEVGVIQALAESLVASSRAARSAVRARPPSQGRGRGARLARRPRRRHAAARPAWRLRVNPACTAATMTAAPSDVDASTRRAFPAARSTPPCGSCRRPSARRCSRSTCSAGWSTISPTTARGRAPARAAALGEWRARPRCALCRPAGRPGGFLRSRCRPSACDRRISSP